MRSVFKAFEKFKLTSHLKPEEATGKFTHSVETARKVPGPNEDVNKQKFLNDWYLKRVSTLEEAWLEVVAQEFLRLFYPQQPKTRIVMSKTGEVYVASKGIPSFTRLESSDRENLFSSFYRGLGKIQLLALYLNETDLKRGNVGKDLFLYILKIDGDNCFKRLKESLARSRRKAQPFHPQINPTKELTEEEFAAAQAKHNFTGADFAALPGLKNYRPFNWLDLIQEGKPCQSSLIDPRMSFNKEYRLEVFETALQILLFPTAMVNMFVKHYVPYSFANTIINELQTRKTMLRQSILGNTDFLNYVNNINLDQFLNNYQTLLTTFTASNKVKLFQNIKFGQFHLDAYLREKFRLLKDHMNKEFVKIEKPKANNSTHHTTPQASRKRARAHHLDRYTLCQIHELISDPNLTYEEVAKRLDNASTSALYKHLKKTYHLSYSALRKSNKTSLELQFGAAYYQTGAQFKANMNNNTEGQTAKKQKTNSEFRPTPIIQLQTTFSQPQFFLSTTPVVPMQSIKTGFQPQQTNHTGLNFFNYFPKENIPQLGFFDPNHPAEPIQEAPNEEMTGIGQRVSQPFSNAQALLTVFATSACHSDKQEINAAHERSEQEFADQFLDLNLPMYTSLVTSTTMADHSVNQEVNTTNEKKLDEVLRTNADLTISELTYEMNMPDGFYDNAKGIAFFRQQETQPPEKNQINLNKAEELHINSVEFLSQ